MASHAGPAREMSWQSCVTTRLKYAPCPTACAACSFPSSFTAASSSLPCPAHLRARACGRMLRGSPREGTGDCGVVPAARSSLHTTVVGPLLFSPLFHLCGSAGTASVHPGLAFLQILPIEPGKKKHMGEQCSVLPVASFAFMFSRGLAFSFSCQCRTI